MWGCREDCGTDYSKQNRFVFECVCSEMRLGPGYTGSTFCVANSIASHAISAVQALPACTLAYLLVLRGDVESGLGQQNLDGLVLNPLVPNRLISTSATGLPVSQGDLLAD